MISTYILMMVGAVLVNNFVLTRFLGICPFLGVSRRFSTAAGMSLAVIFVMTAASVVTWLLHHAVLAPLGVEYLQTVGFILVIATFVQLVELALKKLSPTLHRALGIYLPLITTNCAVLGVAVLNIRKGHGFLETTIFGFGAAVGFALALVIFTGLRERLERADPPRAFRGVAVSLLAAGLLSLAFMGFGGLVQ